ncbi:MAG: metallophosphoesterase family protein [Verrucomicrobiales bacterium]
MPMPSLPPPIRSYIVMLLFAVACALRGDPDDLLHGTVERVDTSGFGTGRLFPASTTPVHFAVIGDYGIGSVKEREVAQMIENWGPDFVITVGDNNYGSLASNPEYFDDLRTDWSRLIGDYYGNFMLGRRDQRYFEQRSPVQRFFPSPGNHDTTEADGYDPTGSTSGIEGYLEYFLYDSDGERRLPVDRGALHNDVMSYYAFRRGPIDFFMLDSEPSHSVEELEAEREWFDRELSASTARWKFAAFHHSPFSSSAHGDHPHMHWPELSRTSAIFCGHDHVYERLVYDAEVQEGEIGSGPPIFISALAGARAYGFYGVKPQSRFRFDTYGGALRVIANETGAVFQFRAFNSDQQIEEVIEEFRLGGEVSDDSDDFSFYAEKGVMAQLVTLTPAPLTDPPLNPALDLFDPDGVMATSASAGALDGRNVRLTHEILTTGTWRVRLRAEARGAGTYRLAVELAHPDGGLAAWMRRHFFAAQTTDSAMDADPDGDGMINAVEYAFVRDPWLSDAEDMLMVSTKSDGLELTVELPAPLPTDVYYAVEMSGDLSPTSWTPIAERSPFHPWATATILRMIPIVPRKQRLVLSLPFSNVATRRFFRLRVVPNSHE